ncbi:Transcriptional regulator [Cupriavidus basilensis]|uniref:Transcriptional regulator n=1 Tax=Cupriavidus basilensis TaxID=68895 RepID=A0A0C4YPB3_9BURK|nr:Transcriptional regulator [Cupriavidus basilensis]
MTKFNRLHVIRQVDRLTLRPFLSAIEQQQIGRAAIRENVAASTAIKPAIKRIRDLEDIVNRKAHVAVDAQSCTRARPPA